MTDFDFLVDRTNTDSAKWGKYAGKDILPMWVADMDFLSPPEVIQALQQRVGHGVFGYAQPPEVLSGLIVDHLAQTYRWAIQPQWIVWLPGLVTGINVACRSVGSPGDAVVTHVPVYPPFLTAPRFSDRNLQTFDMVCRKNRWLPDLEQMEQAIDEKTRLFLLCNPHNPTGRAFTEKELTDMADLCLKHDLVVCSDEIHCDLVLEPGCRHLPLASLHPEIADRTITLMAPSKTYNIPGLGCSFAVISNPSLKKRFTRAMQGIVPHVNALGYAAALAAYSHCDQWLKDLLLYLKANRDLVQNTIDGLDHLSMKPVEATYLAWIDARGCGVENPQRFFEEHGVGLSDGADFGAPRYVRLNFGCTRKLLQSALDRMVHALSAGKP
ncbi:MAG: PatB family C-S lyase [Desulfosarcinaceae bacterium]